MRNLNMDFYYRSKKLEGLLKSGRAKPHRVRGADMLVMCYSDSRQKVVLVGPVLKCKILVGAA